MMSKPQLRTISAVGFYIEAIGIHLASIGPNELPAFMAYAYVGKIIRLKITKSRCRSASVIPIELNRTVFRVSFYGHDAGQIS